MSRDDSWDAPSMSQNCKLIQIKRDSQISTPPPLFRLILGDFLIAMSDSQGNPSSCPASQGYHPAVAGLILSRLLPFNTLLGCEGRDPRHGRAEGWLGLEYP